MRNQIKWLAVVLGGLMLWAGGCKKGPKIGPETAAIVNQTEIKNSDVEKVFQNRISKPGKPAPEEALL